MTNEAVTASLTSVGAHEKHAADPGNHPKRPLENASPGTEQPYGQASSSSQETRQSSFAKLSSELLMHLVKEEATLFPYIARMEEAVSRKEAFPRPAYGTVANPVRMMMMEHDASSTDFKGIRQASNNYESPPDASPNYEALYQDLKELEQDLQVHSDLEDKVLFPRAIALEGVAESIAGNAKTSRP